MPVPVMGLVAQPTLEDWNLASISFAENSTGYTNMAASVSYTLWRNPDDHTDPVNLTELDDVTLRSLHDVPAWPRPAWMVEQIERMRYPLLWEAVRTTWHREPSALSSPHRVLVDHVNYVLMNRFRTELGLGEIGSTRFRAVVSASAVNDQVRVSVDGVEMQGFEIATDPFVYAIGADIGGGTVVTAVVPRDELDFVRIEFVERSEPTRRD